MKRTTKNNDIFGDHITNKLEGAGNVAHWNQMMEEADGPTGTMNPTHGRVTQRASAPGAPTTIKNVGRRVNGSQLDSLNSIPVHGRPGITAASLAREAAAKARRKPRME